MADCYNCKFASPAPGSSHHQECAHPIPTAIGRFTAIRFCSAGGFSITGTNKETGEEKDILTMKFNPHGVRNGWCLWPLNFDPCWVDKCTGFQKRGDCPPLKHNGAALPSENSTSQLKDTPHEKGLSSEG